MAVLEALLGRLGRSTPVASERATALGAVASSAEHCDCRGFLRHVWPHFARATRAFEKACVDWTAGGMVWTFADSRRPAIRESEIAPAWAKAAAYFKRWGEDGPRADKLVQAIDELGLRAAAAAAVLAPSKPAPRL